MPRIIYDIPDWGYDLTSYRKHKYKRSLQEDLTYIDSLRGYSLYMYDSNGQYSKHFVLLDHTNETIKYKSMLMDTMHNGKFSQTLVWRDKNDDALKGISSQIIVDYYLDIFTTLYSDDTQSLHGQKLWRDLIDNNPYLNFGSYNIEHNLYDGISDFDLLYKSVDRDNIVLFVQR